MTEDGPQWNPYSANCPTRVVLDRVADNWAVLVLGLLGHGPVRFNHLRRRIDGISQKMLTQTLKNLEADGLVTRTVFPTVPVTVEYALTRSARVSRPPLTTCAAGPRTTSKPCSRPGLGSVKRRHIRRTGQAIRRTPNRGAFRYSRPGG